MNKNRFAESVAVAVGLVVLSAAPGFARAQNAQPVQVSAPNAALSGAQPRSVSTLEDDFAGLTYTDEQKAEIEKIRKASAAQKQVIAKDVDLTADQKDAMITGYTRLEYGRIFKVLTPDQQRQVRDKIVTRKNADLAARRKQPPQN